MTDAQRRVERSNSKPMSRALYLASIRRVTPVIYMSENKRIYIQLNLS